MIRKTKATIFDLDGTLMNQDSKLSDETIEGIKKLSESSYIIINSGRNKVEVFQLTQDISAYVDFYISSNGACICDKNKNEIFKILIEDSVTRNIIKEYIAYGGSEADIIAVTDDEYLINKDFSDFEREQLTTRPYRVIESWEQLLNKTNDINLLMVTSIPGFKNHMREFLAERGIQIASELQTTYISVGQKHHGCIKVCDIINLDIKECFAIGDNGNDIKMLEVVGYPHLMANASEEVKEKLKHVTVINRTNDEDGAIYAALEYLEKINEMCLENAI